MTRHTYPARDERRLIRRFWQSASGFWRGASAWRVWLFTALLFITVVTQLLVQYWLNYWNRDFFNAIQQRDTVAVWTQAKPFFSACRLQRRRRDDLDLGPNDHAAKMAPVAQQAIVRLLVGGWPVPSAHHVEGIANPGIPDRRAATFIGIINSHEFFMCNFSVLFF
jgi:hypothetical protein